MSADLAAMRPSYNNIADTLRTCGAHFPFRAGATTSAKPNLIYPFVLGSSPESGVTYNNITCGSPGGGAPPDPPTLSNPFKGPSVGAGLPAPRVERNGEKERKERKEKGKGWTGKGYLVRWSRRVKMVQEERINGLNLLSYVVIEAGQEAPFDRGKKEVALKGKGEVYRGGSG